MKTINQVNANKTKFACTMRSHIAAAIFLSAAPAVISCSEGKIQDIPVSASPVPAPQAAQSKAVPSRTAQKLSSEELEDHRVAVRLDAIQEAENFDNARSFAVLAHAMSDPSREVKDAALEALMERHGTDVTHAIRRGLDDSDPEFRLEVLEALAEHGDLESLRTAQLDPSEEVRERAAELLENAGY
jgi:HEAT repeat protein